MFPAKLHSIDEKRVARGSDFTSLGELTQNASKQGVVHLDRSRAETLAAGLRDTTFEVRSVESKPYRRQPYAPFRTTTLQQEASRKLGWGASRTMSVAQRLYENGFITYMRTDSMTLSEHRGLGRAAPGPRAVRRRTTSPTRRASTRRR